MDLVRDWRILQAVKSNEPSVRPLAVVYRSGDFEPAGSSVLVWIRGERYLVSASHVLKGDRFLHVGTRRDWLCLPPPYVHTDPPESDRTPLFFEDYGWVYIPEDLESRFEACRFLPSTEVDLTTEVQRSDPASYYTAGYPLNRFRIRWRRRAVQANALAYRHDPAPPSKYEELGLDPDRHLLFQYPVRHGRGVRGHSRPPKLVGMSGGGIFCLRTPLELGTILIGIVTHLLPEHGVVVGARLDSVVRRVEEWRQARADQWPPTQPLQKGHPDTPHQKGSAV